MALTANSRAGCLTVQLFVAFVLFLLLFLLLLEVGVMRLGGFVAGPLMALILFLPLADPLLEGGLLLHQLLNGGLSLDELLVVVVPLVSVQGLPHF